MNEFLNKTTQFAVKLQQIIVDLLFVIYLTGCGFMLYDIYKPDEIAMTVIFGSLLLVMGCVIRFLILAVLKMLNYALGIRSKPAN